MRPALTPDPGEAAPDAEYLGFALGLADDFELLADLHDREPARALVEALQQSPLEDGFALVLKSGKGRAAFTAFAEAVKAVPVPPDARALDELAAGYADVYLRHTYRASPSESVWLTEDGLEQQTPMFQARAWYRRHHLRVTDWANRPDDHMVLQLRFLAHVTAHAKTPAELDEVAEFLDQHLLRWIGAFAGRLEQHGALAWYAALAGVTAAYLDEVRDLLVEVTGRVRPAPESMPIESCRKAEPAAPAAYVPGVAPSW